jgi:hypothetical protein
MDGADGSCCCCCCCSGATLPAALRPLTAASHQKFSHESQAASGAHLYAGRYCRPFLKQVMPTPTANPKVEAIGILQCPQTFHYTT